MAASSFAVKLYLPRRTRSQPPCRLHASSASWHGDYLL